MKIFYELLLKASTWAAEKIYKQRVVQVDLHLDNGTKLMIMSREESEKLKRCAKELSKWSHEELDQLNTAIKTIKQEEAK